MLPDSLYCFTRHAALLRGKCENMQKPHQQEEDTQHEEGGVAKLSSQPGLAPTVYYSEATAVLGDP